MVVEEGAYYIMLRNVEEFEIKLTQFFSIKLGSVYTVCSRVQANKIAAFIEISLKRVLAGLVENYRTL